MIARQLWRGLLPNASHFVNDPAVAPGGTVYITDSASPVTYRITPAGLASTLMRDDTRFSSPRFGLNGIVYHPCGFLIVVNTGQDNLCKVDLNNGNSISEVGGIGNLPGDDLTLGSNIDLYIVTDSSSQVAQVRNTDGL